MFTPARRDKIAIARMALGADIVKYITFDVVVIMYIAPLSGYSLSQRVRQMIGRILRFV